jgi:hypothetical protein
MSLGSLSEDFRKSLDEMGDELLERQKIAQKNGISEVQAFVSGPVSQWYSGLDDADKAEFDRVFSEINALSSSDLLAIMQADNAPTPFNLVASLFSLVKTATTLEGTARKESN